MGARPTKVSVIVPARDAALTIGRTLDALSRQELPGADAYEVIVVDDGSEDDTEGVVRRRQGGVRLLRQKAAGPATARNAGVAAASGNVLAFTDADCMPTAGWLAAGLACLEGAALVQGAVRPDPDASGGPFDRTLQVEHESGLYELANLFLRREWFERVGGLESWLDQGAGKELGEDVWLGWRVRRAGGRTVFCSEALVHHAVLPRGWRGYISERHRLRHFPTIVRRVPELRRHSLCCRFFLSVRTAAFDLAVVGCLGAGGFRRRAPLALALPYCSLAMRRVKPWRPEELGVAAVRAVADAVGLAALVRGSLRERTVVL